VLEDHRRARLVCPRCFLPPHGCWCVDLPAPVAISVPIAVVRHWRERLKSSNSVRAIVAAVAPCEVHDRGARDTAFTFTPAQGDVLLYPGDATAAPVPIEVRRLVVLDGTWKQARRALHHLPGLAGLPRLVLPAGPAVVRPLRRRPSDGALSTAEAVTEALRLLGEASAADRLEAVYGLQYAALARLRGWELRPEGVPSSSRPIAERS
jgi:DTW domain-containing protein